MFRFVEAGAYARVDTDDSALIAAPGMYCIVPAQTKARAVHDTVYGEITTACPASILRTKTGAKLYLDPDSGALL